MARSQLLRPFPEFTNVTETNLNTGKIWYNSLQVSAQKRFSHGLTFTFAYTFSKLIDDASTYFSQTIFTGPTLTTIGAADAFNRKLERELGGEPLIRVPLLDDDVHDLAGLAEIAEHLFAEEAVAA